MSVGSYLPAQENLLLNRFAHGYEPERFSLANESGMEFYSGSHVRVFFGSVHVEGIDSCGFQLAQNVRPLYPYHSHVFSNIQYGTRLVQGYFQCHTSEASYVQTILSIVERELRSGKQGLVTKNDINPQSAQKPFGLNFTLGDSIEEAVSQFTHGDFNWQELANQYDARMWKDAGVSLKKPEYRDRNIFTRRPYENTFTYNPQGSFLRSLGFDMTIVYGNPEASVTNARLAARDDAGDDLTINEQYYSTETLKDNKKIVQHTTPTDHINMAGTVRRLHGVHIIAGPNTQIAIDGNPIADLYTFIARDMT